MTTHHELLARAIEALRNVENYEKGNHSFRRRYGVDNIITLFDNLPPVVAAEPVAWQYFSERREKWIDCGSQAEAEEKKSCFETRALYTEQQPALSAELTAALVFSVHLMRATRANNEAAIVRAFLDSAPAVTPPNTKPVV